MSAPRTRRGGGRPRPRVPARPRATLTEIVCSECQRRHRVFGRVDEDNLAIDGWSLVAGRWACRSSCRRELEAVVRYVPRAGGTWSETRGNW